MTAEPLTGWGSFRQRTSREPDIDDVFKGVKQLIEDANSDPECFKCQKPITELDQVRIATVRIDGEPVSAWVHAEHAKPGDPVGVT